MLRDAHIAQSELDERATTERDASHLVVERDVRDFAVRGTLRRPRDGIGDERAHIVRMQGALPTRLCVEQLRARAGAHAVERANRGIEQLDAADRSAAEARDWNQLLQLQRRVASLDGELVIRTIPPRLEV